MFLLINNIRHLLLALLMLTSAITLGLSETRAQDEKSTPPQTPQTEAEMIKKASLLIGYKSTEDLLQQGYQFDKDAFLEGVKQAFEKVELKIPDAEVQQCLMAYQKHCEQIMQKKKSAAAEENKKAGEAYLAKNAEKEGVKKLPSGVQYEILNSGSGESPKATDRVTIHYHGTLIDGTMFDSSVKKGKPITMAANQFVPGFSEAVQAMRVGDKWRVVIPSDLAYGSEGGGSIGPNCTLIFDLELLSISKGK